MLDGDRLLLCSDGLWSSMPERRMISLLCTKGRLASRVAQLAREAMDAGAPESDNVSLVACRIGLIDSG